MRYHNVLKGRFICRPNRFIAHVELDGEQVVCHVKNTGRCKELLLPGATVYLEESENPLRKTRYDLIAVEKGALLINIDSMAPNAASEEYLQACFPMATVMKSEQVFAHSRFDFYVEWEKRKIFIEVKGVTLEENGIASFPDAPTERGVKHLSELCLAKEQGYDAMILFVVQMSGMKGFCPNDQTDRAFGLALREARRRGVKILVMECAVTPDSMHIRKELPLLF